MRGREATTPVFNYDDIADAYAAAVDSRPYNAWYERPAMLDLLPPVDEARVLDAGCGTGWYAAELAARGARVTAVDVSVKMIAHARRRLSSAPLGGVARRVELRVADLEQPLAFASDAAFDGIISSLVLHYIRDWTSTLSEFRRVLKPGGWLAFSTHHPSSDAIRRRTERYLDTELVEDHWKWVGRVRYYRRPLSAIVQAVAAAGLTIECLAEPLPTEAFRTANPDAYERLRRLPDFLFIRARA